MNFLGVWEPTLVVFNGLCFFEFLTPYTLEGHNFLVFNPIFMIVSVLEKGFKFCLDTRNNGALPLDPACPESLNVRSPAGLPYCSGVFIFLVCTQEKEKKRKEKKEEGWKKLHHV
jgi:hypothetical protein